MSRKILIIEDNVTYADLLSKKFTLEDFEVITAIDGSEGIAKALGQKPDIILIDLLLPKINGIQVMEELRNNEWGKLVPILILTNINPDNEILEIINKNRPADYMVKPQAPLNEIVNKIRIVLQKA